jgi:hypothetical protein
MDGSFRLISSNEAHRKELCWHRFKLIWTHTHVRARERARAHTHTHTHNAVDFQQVFIIAVRLSQLGTFPKRKYHSAHVIVHPCMRYSMIQLHRGL